MGPQANETASLSCSNLSWKVEVTLPLPSCPEDYMRSTREYLRSSWQGVDASYRLPAAAADDDDDDDCMSESVLGTGVQG